MKRKSLIEAVSPEARDFIEAGTPKPQFVQTQPEMAEDIRKYTAKALLSLRKLFNAHDLIFRPVEDASKFACWFSIWYLKDVQESSPSGLQLYDQQAK